MVQEQFTHIQAEVKKLQKFASEGKAHEKARWMNNIETSFIEHPSQDLMLFLGNNHNPNKE